MKDEIKEIITEMQLRNGRYIICKNEDISFSDEDYKAHLLLDYITNLQDRTKELETINEEHRKINGELREENKDLLEETSKLTKLWLKEKIKKREAIFDLQKLECLDNIHITNNAQRIIDDIIKKLQGSDE